MFMLPGNLINISYFLEIFYNYTIFFIDTDIRRQENFIFSLYIHRIDTIDFVTLCHLRLL